MDVVSILDDSVKLTERVQSLRQYFFDTRPSVCVQRARLYTQSWKDTEGMPNMYRRALALKNILENIGLFIEGGELLVGGLAETYRGTSVYPEFSVNWLEKEFKGDPYYFDNRPGDAFDVADAVRDELLDDVIPYWRGRTHEDSVYFMLPEETHRTAVRVKSVDANWITTGGDGHTIPDFDKVVKKGVDAILKEIDDRLARLDMTDGEDIKKSVFLKAARISNEAVLAYAQRYAVLANELAEKQEDDVRRKELKEIARIARRVPAQPAENLREALQSILFYDCAIQLENNGHGISFGRMDQWLYPLYQNDIRTGALTPESALELLNCFWLKINAMHKIKDWPSTKFFIGNLVFQNLTIAGQTEYGDDAVNDLTYLCLASTKKLKMAQPSLTARIFSGTSKQFLRECAKVLRTGIGIPALFNDEAIIPSMLSLGYSVTDAMDYGIVGCVEPAPQGKIGGRYGAAFPNWQKMLEMTVYGGRDPVTGITLKSCRPLDECRNFDEFYQHFKEQMLYNLKQHVILDNCIDTSFELNTPNPLLSSVIEDCIQRGLEIKQGGAKYDITGGQSVGVVSTVNCLAAVRKVVFEDGLVSPAQLVHAMKTNFEDMTTTPTGPVIQQLLLTKGPKFGNDDPDADTIARDIISFWSFNKMAYRNTRHGKGPIGGIFIPGTATVSANVSFGEAVGATPDGRKAGAPLSEGISAYRGTDVNGPTALINSIASVPNIRMPGGQLLNVKLSPSATANDIGLENMIALIRTLFSKKGFHIQFNIVDRETLLDAQRHPENYRDLIVRVAGYSAYFTTLDSDVQNDIILRTEHGL
jgi:formate C-acetyltransferase